MSALSSSYGSWYRPDSSGGRFVPLKDPPGDCDNILCVTGAFDPENLVTQVLNATALIPSGSLRWVVNYTALKAAYPASGKLALTPA